MVLAYCNKIWANRRSPNKMVASNFHGGRCWLSDPDHPNYIAGTRFVRGYTKEWRNALPAGLLSGFCFTLMFCAVSGFYAGSLPFLLPSPELRNQKIYFSPYCTYCQGD